MAIKFNRSQTFATNGTVTASGLHNLVDGLDIYQALITDQTNLTSVGTADELLIADADLTPADAPRAVTVQELFNDALTAGTYTDANLTGNLTFGTATGNRTVSTNATITTGTITTGVIPTLTAGTTTGTAANITSGTIQTLTSSTLASNLTGGTYSGVINATTGTFGGLMNGSLSATSGTITTLTAGTSTSTAATITTGTIPTLTSTTLLTIGTGTASSPAIVPTGDTNTGLFFPAADTLAATTNGVEAVRIDSSGNVGIGKTPTCRLDVTASGLTPVTLERSDGVYVVNLKGTGTTSNGALGMSTNDMVFLTNSTERFRITSDGVICLSKSGSDFTAQGFEISSSGEALFTRNSATPLTIRRNTNDGVLISFYQDAAQEGSISVSGTTVSYNGGHLSRFSQLSTGQRDLSIKKGTVLSNLDEMCEWRDKDGNLLPNEQLNKVKVSDVDGDLNVAGVFVNWDNDDQDNPFDLNMAMTGDMIIRIAQGVVVNRGDLLMSAGDGTAKPQGDDIVRSKTIAKVTSTSVTCTYEDGSYCIPCVLMAC